MEEKKKICAVIGAGDFIGSAIAKRFAKENFLVFAARRNEEKLVSLKVEIEKNGGACETRQLDARNEESVTLFFKDVALHGSLEVCIFNPGGNVWFPFLETTERVFRKVWQICCYGGFLVAREGAGYLVEHGKGSLFFTGATASVCGRTGYAAFASGKFALRGLVQAVALELGPKNIHVAHLIIDAGVDTDWVRKRIASMRGKEFLETLHPDQLINPDSVAETYWQLHCQPRDCWTHELDIRPFMEKW